VNVDSIPDMRDNQEWCPIGSSADLPRGSLRAVRVLGADLALFRTSSGDLGLWDGRCPHNGASLAQGQLDAKDETLRCPFHHWEFSTSKDRRGSCMRIPGCAPRDVRVKDHKTLELDGKIYGGRETIAETARSQALLDASGNMDLSGWFLVARSHELPCEKMFFSKRYSLRRIGDAPHATESGDAGVNEQLTLVELDGGVYGWRHPDGGPPTWQLKASGIDHRVWRKVNEVDLMIHAPLSIVKENGVDFQHFGPIHSSEIERESVEFFVDGPLFRYAWIARYRKIVRFLITEEMQGFGYSVVTTKFVGTPVNILMFAGSTPVDDMLIHSRIDQYCTRGDSSQRLNLARNALYRLYAKFVAHNLMDDLVIWNQQRAVKTMLSRVDGPIMKFRKWGMQFRSSPTQTADLENI